METIIIAAIPGFDGVYDISMCGKYLLSWIGSKRRGGRPKVLKQRINTHGYKYLDLCQCGKRTGRRVHSLVALTYLGSRPVGMEVCHGANKKLDNSVENLSYGTRSQNQRDRVRDGTDNRGEKFYAAKFKEWQVLSINYLLEHKVESKFIQKIFKTSSQQVDHIKHRRRWKHLFPEVAHAV